MENVVGKNLALGIGEGFVENMKAVNKDIESAMKPISTGYSITGNIEAPAAMNANRSSVAPVDASNPTLDKLVEALGNKSNNSTIVLKVDKRVLGQVTAEGINDITKLTGNIPLVIM